ncbi:endonuclease/exonuclease/phosphatase family protein [Oerskovia flava]|uniref:endonuclease/exonuclease/phosphatase family protein n=1 Tax=Oerskovia flava TaxID=2986422 RepID=UPI00223F1754|nr:endonuclease/exonuclease/phosphatase family protein [Oerskovia sp. JB1-3-2]
MSSDRSVPTSSAPSPSSPAPVVAAPVVRADGSSRRRRPGGRPLGLVLWAAAVPVVGVAVVRAVPYDGVTPLAQVVGVTPWAALGAVVVLVAALVARRRALAGLLGVATVAYAAWLVPFVVPGPGIDPDAGPTVRVLAVNAYFGQADAAAVVRMVHEQDVDVLTVVELTTDFEARLEAAGIADVLPHHVDAKVGTGSAGSGLWSATELHDPDTTEFSTFAMPSALVDVGGTPVRVTAVHPVPPLPEITHVWHEETALLAERAHADDTPQILAGDFNATHDHASFRALLGDRFHDATRTAGHGLNLSWSHGAGNLPLLDLDHVVTERTMAIDDVVSLTVPGSDHKALAVTVQVPASS